MRPVRRLNGQFIWSQLTDGPFEGIALETAWMWREGGEGDWAPFYPGMNLDEYLIFRIDLDAVDDGDAP